MHRAFSPEYDGYDPDAANYLNEPVAMSGRELRPVVEPTEPSESERERLGQMVLLDAYREAQGEPEAA